MSDECDIYQEIRKKYEDIYMRNIEKELSATQNKEKSSQNKDGKQ